MLNPLIKFGLEHGIAVSIALVLIVALGVIEYMQWMIGAKSISPIQASLLLNRQAASVLDLREKEEFLLSRIPGAFSIQEVSMEEMLKQLSPKNPIILVSLSRPSLEYLTQLRRAGIEEIYYLEGGMAAWRQADLPTIQTL